MTPPTALSVAGSDPSGGAGIQADLKTFADHGVYGMAVVTALTAQSTTGVTAVHAPPAEFVVEQLRVLLDDMPIAAVKIGMLGGAAVVAAVQRVLAVVDAPVVVDPVMVATSGSRLLEPEAEDAVRALAACATVVTPNLPEAEVLLQGEAPGAWARRTGVALLLKDGHGGQAIVRDALYLPDGSVVRMEHPRVKTRNTHGTGCTLSSAIAARLARGEALVGAVRGGVDYVAAQVAASAGHGLGAGPGPLLHGLVPR